MAYTTINKSTDYFNTKLYTGTGSENAITGVGFQPDMVWIKRRNGARNHQLQDVVRGITKQLVPNETDAEATNTEKVKSIQSDGFTLGTNQDVNASSDTFASWNWKANGAGSSNSNGSITSTVSANTTAGFSIVKYTGTGSGSGTVGHGLGVKPQVVIVKRLTYSDNWVFWIDTTKNGTADKRLILNTTNADYGNYFTSFQNNTFTLPSLSDNAWSASGSDYIAYCFAEKTGYSKFGSYTGNGSSDGTFVYTGFKPAFVIYKGAVGANATDNWEMADNKRSSYNPITNVLYPNLSNAEGTGVTTRMDMLSNGFKMRTNGSDYNGSGQTYIYMAFGQSIVGSNNIPATAR